MSNAAVLDRPTPFRGPAASANGAPPSLDGAPSVGAAARSDAATSGVNAQIAIPQAKADELGAWLYEEIERAKQDSVGRQENYTEWERLYEARPRVARKTEPWVNCANLVVPLIGTAVDSVTARLIEAVFGGKQLWVGTAKSAKWAALANPIQDWINWVGKDVMKMYDVSLNWFLTTVKTGTGILKLPWERRLRNVMYNDENGGQVNEQIVVHDGPKPQSIHPSDFFVSPDAHATKDIQYCEWVAHRGRYTKKLLKELEFSGTLYDVEKIFLSPRTQATDLEAEVQGNTGVSISQYNDYEVWEIWCSYDINEDGIPEELVVTYHPETQTILRAVYNFYRHQERPFHIIPFMPRDNSIWGIGICQMLQDIQEEVTTMHNQRLDNATIANQKAFLRVSGTSIGDPVIGPGAIIDVDDIDDFKELKIGDNHPSLLGEELHTNSIGEKRTGVSDYTSGRESSAIGSRATATSTLALIREGNKRFRMTIKAIRESLRNIAHQVIMLYQQFAADDGVMFEIFSEDEKAIVQEYFKLPPEFSRANIAIDVPALSEADNKEADRQSYIMLLQVMQQFYSAMMEAFTVAQSPQAPPPIKQLALQGAQAGAKMWQRVLEAFDFRDPESFTPNVEDMLMLDIAQMDMMGGMGSGGNNSFGGLASTPPEQGMGPAQPQAGGPQGPVLQGMAAGLR